MERKITLDGAMAASLLEQQREERRRRLRAEPDTQVSVSLPELGRLLWTSPQVIVRYLLETPLAKDPTRKGRIIVTGQRFTTFEQTLKEIRAEKRRGRP